ncbi:MAG: hypothetical protein ACK2UO_12805 [Caldilineaceae bacterium]
MDERNDQDENPLEDAAARMSEGLHGTSVDVEQTSKSHVEAGQVRMMDSAAKSVTASALQMEDSVAGIVRSGSVDAKESPIGVSVSTSLHMQDSSAVVTIAKSVACDEVRSVFFFASRVNGDVQSVFTPLTALAAGAGFALSLVVFVRTLPWLFKAMFRRARRDDA